MKRMAGFYIRHTKLIGVIYCAVPILAWFLWSLIALPFREVYVLRLGLVLTVGCAVAAGLHAYGVKLWLIKHRSPHGPAGPGDGFLIGMSTGLGINFLPPLTSLIASDHPEEAKAIIILAWIGAGVLGALFGLILGAVGRRHVPALQ